MNGWQEITAECHHPHKNMERPSNWTVECLKNFTYVVYLALGLWNLHNFKSITSRIHKSITSFKNYVLLLRRLKRHHSVCNNLWSTLGLWATRKIYYTILLIWASQESQRAGRAPLAELELPKGRVRPISGPVMLGRVKSDRVCFGVISWMKGHNYTDLSIFKCVTSWLHRYMYSSNVRNSKKISKRI